MLAEILFSRGLRGLRGGALASRAYHAGCASSPLVGRRADIKWPLHNAECMSYEIHHTAQHIRYFNPQLRDTTSINEKELRTDAQLFNQTLT
ncbi:MAG: hypothetical protein II200_06120 [Bacteroidaceae bacterium]|nr:hypothetical protein [Bacteroidaceae bacterium]